MSYRSPFAFLLSEAIIIAVFLLNPWLLWPKARLIAVPKWRIFLLKQNNFAPNSQKSSIFPRIQCFSTLNLPTFIFGDWALCFCFWIAEPGRFKPINFAFPPGNRGFTTLASRRSLEEIDTQLVVALVLGNFARLTLNAAEFSPTFITQVEEFVVSSFRLRL